MRELRQALLGRARHPAAATVVAGLVLGRVLVEASMPPAPADAPGRGPELVQIGSKQSGPAVRDLARASSTLSGVGAYTGWIFDVEMDERRGRAIGGLVTVGALELLGARPIAGRLFDAADDGAGARPRAVLGYELWHALDGRIQPGSTIALDGVRHEVIGIVAPGFRFPTEGASVWATVSARLPDAVGVRHADFLDVVGRVRPGVPIARVGREVSKLTGLGSHDAVRRVPAPVRAGGGEAEQWWPRVLRFPTDLVRTPGVLVAGWQQPG